MAEGSNPTFEIVSCVIIQLGPDPRGALRRDSARRRPDAAPRPALPSPITNGASRGDHRTLSLPDSPLQPFTGLRSEDRSVGGVRHGLKRTCCGAGRGVAWNVSGKWSPWTEERCGLGLPPPPSPLPSALSALAAAAGQSALACVTGSACGIGSPLAPVPAGCLPAGR